MPIPSAVAACRVGNRMGRRVAAKNPAKTRVPTTFRMATTVRVLLPLAKASWVSMATTDMIAANRMAWAGVACNGRCREVREGDGRLSANRLRKHAETMI